MRHEQEAKVTLASSRDQYLSQCHTEFGKLTSGGYSTDLSNPWQVLINGRWVLFFGVSLPAVAIT
jgi:hypothetical protein